jgi:hypothetical protein
MTDFETPTDLMNASAEDVLARAEADDATFVKSDELRAWVADGLEQLS